MDKIVFALLTIGLLGYVQCQLHTFAPTESTTTKPTATMNATTEDPLDRFMNAYTALQAECTLKDANSDCDDQRIDMDYKISRGLKDACDYKLVYSVCMAIRCESTVAFLDVFKDFRDACDEDPLDDFIKAYTDLQAGCTLKDRNDDCYDEEWVLNDKISRGWEEACDYQMVYLNCVTVKCMLNVPLTDALTDFQSACDGFVRSTAPATTESATIKSTTTAKPGTTEDPLDRFMKAYTTLQAECTLKDANGDCDDERSDLNNKISRGLTDACDYRLVYSVCMSIRCETTDVLKDAVQNFKDVCDGI